MWPTYHQTTLDRWFSISSTAIFPLWTKPHTECGPRSRGRPRAAQFIELKVRNLVFVKDEGSREKTERETSSSKVMVYMLMCRNLMMSSRVGDKKSPYPTVPGYSSKYVAPTANCTMATTDSTLLQRNQMILMMTLCSMIVIHSQMMVVILPM